jgi:hypothetical protein
MSYIASSAKASILSIQRVVRFVHNAAFTVLFKKRPAAIARKFCGAKSLFPQAAQ